MAPRSTILSSLARTQIQRASAKQFRQYTTARAAAAPWNFKSPAGRIGSTVLMYFPVVAVVMFWPYAVAPVMDFVAEHSSTA